MFVLRLLPVVEIGLTFCEVELDLAEMACVSRNIRRTFHVPSGVPIQRSISERSVSYPCYSAAGWFLIASCMIC